MTVFSFLFPEKIATLVTWAGKNLSWSHCGNFADYPGKMFSYLLNRKGTTTIHSDYY